MHSPLYVQYGCGIYCPNGWVNFDASPRLRIEQLPGVGPLLDARGKRLFPKAVRYGDIVRGLPVPPSSASGVFCSHVLEHIDRTSIIIALKNTFNMLEKGGVFRLVVPDLSWRAKAYVQSQQNKDPEAADRFMRDCYLGQEAEVRDIMGRIRLAFGNAGHRWMYDESSMKALLKSTGFTEVRRCFIGDAQDRTFDLVEADDRFVDDGQDELAFEAVRPQ